MSDKRKTSKSAYWSIYHLMNRIVVLRTMS